LMALSHAGIVSKRLNIPSNFVAPDIYIVLCIPNVMVIVDGEAPNGDVESVEVKYEKIAIFRPI